MSSSPKCGEHCLRTGRCDGGCGRKSVHDLPPVTPAPLKRPPADAAILLAASKARGDIPALLTAEMAHRAIDVSGWFAVAPPETKRALQALASGRTITIPAEAAVKADPPPGRCFYPVCEAVGDCKEGEPCPGLAPAVKPEWVAGQSGAGTYDTFLQSSDFTFDACLYLTGDYASQEVKLAHAQTLAAKLNAPAAPAPTEDPTPAAPPRHIATLHSDGYWTWNGAEPYESCFAGWRLQVYAEPVKPKAVPVAKPAPSMSEQDVAELKAWRELFEAFVAQGLTALGMEVPKLWPSPWPKDVGMVGFALHRAQDQSKKLQDFLEAADALRASLPPHWHDEAVTNFDDARADLNAAPAAPTPAVAATQPEESAS